MSRLRCVSFTSVIDSPFLYLEVRKKYLVIAGNNVVREFSGVERLIAEVNQHCVSNRDPHYIDYIPQKSTHDFKKRWQDWRDINLSLIHI